MYDWSVTKADIPQEFEMWADIFTFRKRYYKVPPLDNEQESTIFFQMATAAADELNNKYGTKICGDIVRDILRELSERSMKKNGVNR